MASLSIEKTIGLLGAELTFSTATWVHPPGAAPRSMTLYPGFKRLYR